MRRGDVCKGATEGVSERGMDRGWESEGGQGGLREIEGGVGASECEGGGAREAGRAVWEQGRAYEERRWLFVCVCGWVFVGVCLSLFSCEEILVRALVNNNRIKFR